MARNIALEEGGAENLSIAQVKEVLRQTLLHLRAEWGNGNEEGVITLIKNA